MSAVHLFYRNAPRLHIVICVSKENLKTCTIRLMKMQKKIVHDKMSLYNLLSRRTIRLKNERKKKHASVENVYRKAYKKIFFCSRYTVLWNVCKYYYVWFWIKSKRYAKQDWTYVYYCGIKRAVDNIIRYLRNFSRADTILSVAIIYSCGYYCFSVPVAAIISITYRGGTPNQLERFFYSALIVRMGTIKMYILL